VRGPFSHASCLCAHTSRVTPLALHLAMVSPALPYVRNQCVVAGLHLKLLEYKA
jgi:hypothetical protein